jgi:hypothetical protein
VKYDHYCHEEMATFLIADEFMEKAARSPKATAQELRTFLQSSNFQTRQTILYALSAVSKIVQNGDQG